LIHKLQQIIASTGLASNARHFKTTKGMAMHERARDLSIDVQVAHFKFSFGLLDAGGAS